MHIQSIPMCKINGWVITSLSHVYLTKLYLSLGTGSSNNYAYLVKDDKTNDAVIIDPANPPEYVWSHRNLGYNV